MTSPTPLRPSVDEAREALHLAEHELAAIKADAVEGLDPTITGIDLAAAEGEVALAGLRLQGARDRVGDTGTDPRAAAIAAEIAAGYAEQDAAKLAARDERAAAGYPSLSDGAGFLITQDGPRPTHAESLIGAER